MTVTDGWRKSRYSNAQANCVEVKDFQDGTVGVRDSKDNGIGPVLKFAPDAWDTFIGGLRVGDFDRP